MNKVESELKKARFITQLLNLAFLSFGCWTVDLDISDLKLGLRSDANSR